jgi:ATP-binding cassette subfamily G (WHITE) protein 2 (PDR)
MNDGLTILDFLTSMTSPQERIIRDGFEGRAPRTPDEFAARWKESAIRARLMTELDDYEKEFPMDAEHLERFKESRKAQQSRHQYVVLPIIRKLY